MHGLEIPFNWGDDLTKKELVVTKERVLNTDVVAEWPKAIEVVL